MNARDIYILFEVIDALRSLLDVNQALYRIVLVIIELINLINLSKALTTQEQHKSY